MCTRFSKNGHNAMSMLLPVEHTILAKIHDVKEDEFISRSINVRVLVQVILRAAQYPAVLMNGVCWIVFRNFAD